MVGMSIGVGLERAIDDLVGFSGTPGRILICGSLYLAGEVLRENV